MPLQSRSDKDGKYIRWGTKGKKYYYNTPRGLMLAKARAMAQARSIEWRKHNLK